MGTLFTIMFNFRRALNAVAPSPKQSEDGRDQWPSRTSYVLASMGGAIGFGNLLRFPSQVFNNNGIQWFIPYVMATSSSSLSLSSSSRLLQGRRIALEAWQHTTA